VYAWSFGYSISFFVKSQGDFFERNIMRIGLGLGTIPIVGVFLNLLHIPINWKIFLLLGLITPIICCARAYFKQKFALNGIRLPKLNLYFIILIILFTFTLFMYLKGAFTYPYLEDDDPWEHAKSTNYVAIEQNLNNPVKDVDRFFYYLDPYPPGYAIIMGILHQTSLSVMWVLKFFNALIISLTIFFFFYFTKTFMNSSLKALFATFILSMIPCYLSHFIWSHSLIVLLMIVAFYSLEKIKEDKRWLYVSAVVIASIAVTQPEQAIKFGFMLAIYYLINVVSYKNINKEILASILLGVLMSLAWWLLKAKSMLSMLSVRGMTSNISSVNNVDTGFLIKIWHMAQKLFNPNSGSATRIYDFNDFMFAKTTNMINNPIGVGVFIMVLLIISIIWIWYTFYYKTKKDNTLDRNYYNYIFKFLVILTIISFFMSFINFLIFIPIFIISISILGLFLIDSNLIEKEKNVWKIIVLLWLLFTFLGVHGKRLPLGFMAFRFWMLLAIPVSILAGEAIGLLNKLFKHKFLQFGLLSLIFIAVFITSGYPKYKVNTAIWPPGGSWASMEEVQGYLWLTTLPKNTKVFAYYHGDKVHGFDMFMCSWCKDELEMIKEGPNMSVEDIYSILQKNKYKHIIIDAQTANLYGLNQTNRLISDMLEFKKFVPTQQSKDFLAFSII
jgi:hypothetical protein